MDIDAAVIRIAQNEFGTVASENLRIYCADAFEFAKSLAVYDLIIVDLLFDNQVPSKFWSDEFW